MNQESSETIKTETVETEQNNPEQNNPEQDNIEQNNIEQNNIEQDNIEQNNPEQDNPEQDNIEQNNPEQNNPEQDNIEQNNPEQDNIEQNNIEQDNIEQDNIEQDNIEQNNPRVTIPLVNMDQQINITPENDKIIITLPPENEKLSNQWENILDDFKSRLLLIEKNWLPHTEVKLIAQKNLLDNRQLQNISDLLREFQLDLSLVITNRRQTAVVAASAGYSVQQQKIPKPLTIQQETAKQNLANPLYLQTTIRSGTEICHTGTVIILGDVNPGGSIIAGGDVFIWGSLKGMAHAGAQGDSNRIIMALKMDPTQLRIAHIIARSPDNLPEDFDPEVACIFEEGIKITSAWNFAKTNYLSEKKDNWTKNQNKS